MIIRGGRVIDPSQHLDRLIDVRIEGEKIVELAEHLVPQGEEQVLEAAGCVVAPGFIDIHVHLREPGHPEKETIATGSAAAVAGGFTAVACMPNTTPPIDSVAVLEEVRTLAHAAGKARVYPIASFTRGREGREPVDYSALARAGAVAFSDDGNTVMRSSVMWVAAIAAMQTPGRFISHCEDEDLKGRAVMTLGLTSNELGVVGAPSITEDIVVMRDLLIAYDTGKPWHIAHLSTANGLDFMRWARSKRIDATCEVTPHHLLLTDASVGELGAAAKVNPPLRREEDARALRDAVREGTIDVFASDHAPHTPAEKSAALANAAVGFTGLEIAVGAYALAVPDLPLERFVTLLSTSPARTLGIPGGTLKLHSAADITIFADRAWTVDPARFVSRGKSTPFAGKTLPRRALATIVGGKLLMNGLA